MEVPMQIHKKGSEISTMIFNQNLNSLLVGKENGCLLQFERDLFGDLKKLKDYGDIELGEISASDWLGDFAVVGGDTWMISLINMKKREVIQKKIKTAIELIYSLQFCKVSLNQIYLVVGGIGRKDYSDSKTDWFDVSDFFNLGPGKGESIKITKKKLIQKLKAREE